MLEALATTAGAGMALPLVGGIVGNLAGVYGQMEANRTNRDIADQTNQMNQTNAREQMAFQERMANTSHRRARADLEAAGLNPLLAATDGAPAPQGAAGAATAARVENPYTNLGQGVTSALSTAYDARRLAMEIEGQKKTLKQQDAQIQNLNMDTAVKAKGIPEAQIKNRLYQAGDSILKKITESTGTSSRSQADKDFKKALEDARENQSKRQQKWLKHRKDLERAGVPFLP